MVNQSLEALFDSITRKDFRYAVVFTKEQNKEKKYFTNDLEQAQALVLQFLTVGYDDFVVLDLKNKNIITLGEN